MKSNRPENGYAAGDSALAAGSDAAKSLKLTQ